MQYHIGKIDSGPVRRELVLTTPVPIESGDFTISTQNIYRVKAGSGEYVVELGVSPEMLGTVPFVTSSPQMRTASNGRFTDGIIPLSYRDGKLVVYVGAVSEDLLFTFTSASGDVEFEASFRQITAEEKNSFPTFDIASEESLAIPVTEGADPWIKAIRFTDGGAPVSGVIFDYSCSAGNSPELFTVAPSRSRYGLSSDSAGIRDKTIIVSSGNLLSYGYIYSPGKTSEGSITISVR